MASTLPSRTSARGHRWVGARPDTRARAGLPVGSGAAWEDGRRWAGSHSRRRCTAPGSAGRRAPCTSTRPGQPVDEKRSLLIIFYHF